LLHGPKELGLDVVPLQVQQAHEKIRLLQDETSGVHAYEYLKDLFDASSFEAPR
jgi:hypothetical protein